MDYRESTQLSRPTSLSPIALAAFIVSLMCALGQYASVRAASSVEWAVWLDSLPDDFHFTALGIAETVLLVSLPTAVALNLVAGQRRSNDRIAGVVGGLLLLATPLFLVASFALSR